LSLRISDLLTLKYADLNLEERSLKLTEVSGVNYLVRFDDNYPGRF
jgi:hypothetical protein